MHVDARELENGSLIEGDICIVGSGASGLSIALDWIGSPYKVILLEGGGFSYEDETQDMFGGKNIGQPYYPLKSSRLHYFGGTTGHWGGMCATMDAIDFEVRDWVPNSGWPIKRADLDPFYARAQPILDLGPYEYGLEYWKKQDEELVSLPLDESVVYNKMWQFSPPTRFGKKYRDTIVQAKNLTLYTYANVVDIKAFDHLKAVREVTVKNKAGKTHTVRARYFILACNGIQNPRLLLASNSQFPQGLGNENDNVGRYFMEHLEIKSAELWLKKNDRMRLYELRGKPRAELAITAAAQRSNRMLNGTASLIPLNLAKDVTANIKTWSADDPRKSQEQLHEAHGEADKKKWLLRLTTDLYQSYEFFTRIEQYPNPDSRVTLDTERDALGVPRAKLDWKLSQMEKYSLRKLYELIGHQMGFHDTGRVRLMEYLRDPGDTNWPDFTGGGWHHMGCTRMHEDPKKGVVDPNCRVFSMENLFIAGDSCFTTGGAVNPTLTIVALSLRLSDHVRGLMDSKGSNSL
jgi:choline dehydrogenase-like flavoprotein